MNAEQLFNLGYDDGLKSEHSKSKFEMISLEKEYQLGYIIGFSYDEHVTQLNPLGVIIAIHAQKYCIPDNEIKDKIYQKFEEAAEIIIDYDGYFQNNSQDDFPDDDEY